MTGRLIIVVVLICTAALTVKAPHFAIAGTADADFLAIVEAHLEQYEGSFPEEIMELRETREKIQLLQSQLLDMADALPANLQNDIYRTWFVYSLENRLALHPPEEIVSVPLDVMQAQDLLFRELVTQSFVKLAESPTPEVRDIVRNEVAELLWVLRNVAAEHIRASDGISIFRGAAIEAGEAFLDELVKPASGGNITSPYLETALEEAKYSMISHYLDCSMAQTVDAANVIFQMMYQDIWLAGYVLNLADKVRADPAVARRVAKEKLGHPEVILTSGSGVGMFMQYFGVAMDIVVYDKTHLSAPDALIGRDPNKTPERFLHVSEPSRLRFNLLPPASSE